MTEWQSGSEDAMTEAQTNWGGLICLSALLWPFPSCLLYYLALPWCPGFVYLAHLEGPCSSAPTQTHLLRSSAPKC